MGGGDTSPYDTTLSKDEESKFQDWKQKYAPNDSGYDYDLRGAFKAGLKPDPETGHWPDTFKKPNHPTFSNESIYYPYAPQKAGHWEGEKFIPPDNVIIPATGAAKYWYVDPRARPMNPVLPQFDPAQYADEQGHDAYSEALARLGL